MKLSLALMALLCSAQEPAASIKPHGTSPPSSTPGFNLRDVHVRALIQVAYGLQEFQVLGGPDWIASDRFDVQVPAPRTPHNFQLLHTKLQALLQDRLKLQFHREKRELPIYTLTLTQGGPRMWKTAQGGCVPLQSSGAGPRPANSNKNQHAPGEPGYCGIVNRGIDAWLNRTWDGVGVPMLGTEELPGLVTMLSDSLHRVVIDKTGLTGKYDFHLVWDPSPDQSSEGPSLISAVEDQLGLRLEPGTGPVQVLVIDRLEKPR